MIWYVDIEHESALADPKRTADFTRVRNERASICGQAAGVRCDPILYRQVSWDLARQVGLQAITISGNTTDWADYDFETFKPLFDLIESGQFAVLGLCGGHQLLGLMAYAQCDAIRRSYPGEPESGGFAPGWFKEVGFMPVKVVKPDPIFQGLPESPTFFESHYWEIKRAPEGFDLLASTSAVQVQVIKHRERLIYGTQFHPEVHNSDHPDGFTLLQNFFNLAKLRIN